MEPPLKRQRLAGSSYPRLDLKARRAQNDFRLKSIFESIFDKYGQNFDGIGDEIDMETGEIVVDNGHIQGMTDERDIGGTKYFINKLEGSDYEDDKSSVDYSEGYSESLKSHETREAAATKESEVSELSDIDADSLTGDVPAESHQHQLVRNPGKAVSIPSDDEEDELASSDIEWASHRKDRSGARESWRLKDKSDLVKESAIEPAWRAPPLPNILRLKGENEVAGLTNVDEVRDHSDDERAGVSLWTPEIKKCRRRRREDTNLQGQRSLSFGHDQGDNADGLLSDSSDFKPVSRRGAKWTQEEEKLLIHLKTNTHLSATAMQSYFPERHGSAVRSHWTYMLTHSKGQATISKTKTQQTGKLQKERGFPEAENFVRSSSKPIEDPEDHHPFPQCQIGGDHGTPKGYTVRGSPLISNPFGVHVRDSTGEPFSSSKDCGCKVAESADSVHSIDFDADADQSHGLSRSLEVSMRGKHLASKTPDQRSEVVSENGFEARSSSPTASSDAEPDSKGAEPYSDTNVTPEIRYRGTTTIAPSDSPKQSRISRSRIHYEESIPPTAEPTIQKEGSTVEELQENQSRNLTSARLARFPNEGISSASYKPVVELPNQKQSKRQIVQVVIPLAAKSSVLTKHGSNAQSPFSNHPNDLSTSVTAETERPVFNRQLSATTESVPAALGPSLPRQENPAIRTPNSSPSVAAADSQYVASTAPVLDDVRSSLGPEIADSQPLSTPPVSANPVPELGDDATRPIVLDAEEPPLPLTPNIASPIQRATKKILDSDVQPLHLALVKVTPTRKRIEEATESDVVESGSHPMDKTFRAVRSPLKRWKGKTTAESFPSVCPVIDDHSEDELSYL